MTKCKSCGHECHCGCDCDECVNDICVNCDCDTDNDHGCQWL